MSEAKHVLIIWGGGVRAETLTASLREGGVAHAVPDNSYDGVALCGEVAEGRSHFFGLLLRPVDCPACLAKTK